MRKNSLTKPEFGDSRPSDVTKVVLNESDFDGIVVFRALGFIVGLLSFMVGTAFFMLGYSLNRESLSIVGCILYSLSLVSILGRPFLSRVNPTNEWQALGVVAVVLATGSLLYFLLRLFAQSIGLP